MRACGLGLLLPAASQEVSQSQRVPYASGPDEENARRRAGSSHGNGDGDGVRVRVRVDAGPALHAVSA